MINVFETENASLPHIKSLKVGTYYIINSFRTKEITKLNWILSSQYCCICYNLSLTASLMFWHRPLSFQVT